MSVCLFGCYCLIVFLFSCLFVCFLYVLLTFRRFVCVSFCLLFFCLFVRLSVVCLSICLLSFSLLYFCISLSIYSFIDSVSLFSWDFILDDNSEICRKQSLLFYLFKALVRQRALIKSPKTPIFLHACAILSELPSNISTMLFSVISHGTIIAILN